MSSFPENIPPLGDAEAAHAASVAARLRDRVTASGGFLPFADFMQIALYEPGLGYYDAGATKLGAAGDFVTAPESSELFGLCVATQCAEIVAQLGRDDVDMLEVGAGTGRLAATVLRELARLDALPARYRILEVSADLRERQRARIAALDPGLCTRVEWLDRLPDSPWRGVLLANEVLDALPCERFRLRDGEVSELGVAVDDSGELREAERPASAAYAEHVRTLRRDAFESQAVQREADASADAHWPDGYTSETCQRVAPWIAACSESLTTGVALLIDYGLPRAQYYHPQRIDGTLVCHARHRAHHAWLDRPGLQDITAWVDFTRVAEAAVANQLDVLGFTTQAGFLLGNDLEARVAAAANDVERARLAGEARRLLLPGEMGEAFKVMALGRAFDAPLRGFALQDLRRSL